MTAFCSTLTTVLIFCGCGSKRFPIPPKLTFSNSSQSILAGPEQKKWNYTKHIFIEKAIEKRRHPRVRILSLLGWLGRVFIAMEVCLIITAYPFIISFLRVKTNPQASLYFMPSTVFLSSAALLKWKGGKLFERLNQGNMIDREIVNSEIDKIITNKNYINKYPEEIVNILTQHPKQKTKKEQLNQAIKLCKQIRQLTLEKTKMNRKLKRRCRTYLGCSKTTPPKGGFTTKEIIENQTNSEVF